MRAHDQTPLTPVSIRQARKISPCNQMQIISPRVNVTKNVGLGSRDNPIIIVTCSSCRIENVSRLQIASKPHSCTSIGHDVG